MTNRSLENKKKEKKDEDEKEKIEKKPKTCLAFLPLLSMTFLFQWSLYYFFPSALLLRQTAKPCNYLPEPRREERRMRAMLLKVEVIIMVAIMLMTMMYRSYSSDQRLPLLSFFFLSFDFFFFCSFSLFFSFL